MPYVVVLQVGSAKTKRKSPPHKGTGFSFDWCLAVTYFRVRMHTIIGAEAFHGPVRDGKGWGHLAIAAKRNWQGLGINGKGLVNPKPFISKAARWKK